MGGCFLKVLHSDFYGLSKTFERSINVKRTLMSYLSVLSPDLVPSVACALTEMLCFSILVIAVQDLVDFEHIEGIEWSQESEDEADETVEGMDVED